MLLTGSVTPRATQSCWPSCGDTFPSAAPWSLLKGESLMGSHTLTLADQPLKVLICR